MTTANEMTAGSVAVTDRLPLPARNGRTENIDGRKYRRTNSNQRFAIGNQHQMIDGGRGLTRP
jgi:hypothetical protein